MSTIVKVTQTGVGLIEVLIAVLVFSVGALGLASFQLAAKRNTFEALQRSFATGLAADIVERMRSNPSELAAYAVSELGGERLPVTDSCDRTPCTPNELARSDINQWSALLSGFSERSGPEDAEFASGGLVSPRICIGISDGTVTVAIAWRGMNRQTNPAGSDCGESAGLYGPENHLRRLLLLTTYIRSS